jgi:hypothetical protein
VRRESGSLPLGSEAVLALRIPSGRLRVEAVEGAAEVAYEIEIHAEADDAAAVQAGLDRVEVRVSGGNEGGKSEIAVERGAAARDVEIEVNLYARVPLTCELTLGVAAGAIAVDRLRGNLRVKSHSGSVDLGEIEGEIDATLHSGNLRIGKVTGPARIEAKSGQVRIDDAGDGVDIRQMAGQVAVQLTATPRRASRVEAMSGEVRLTLAEGVGVDLDAEARSGRVRVEKSFPDRGALRSYRGPLHGGGMPLVVRSAAGSIAVGAAPLHG